MTALAVCAASDAVLISVSVTPYNLVSGLMYLLAIPFTPRSQFDTAETLTRSFFATSSCRKPAFSRIAFNSKRSPLLIKFRTLY
uniref:Uncharacterized protein n=1 Tax=Siphoviridae sp. ctfhy6 TaxID=2825597 RepID=A0A8S5VB20_9CAUD|nr:MAG TPA: hypothetical protein [Siphoviridae sp. ctfhy6]